jgi:hypothetical protein
MNSVDEFIGDRQTDTGTRVVKRVGALLNRIFDSNSHEQKFPIKDSHCAPYKLHCYL